MSALIARLDRFSERFNPVLVREVKQSLRGKFFVITFALTLVFAMLSAVATLLFATADDAIGPSGGMLFTRCSVFLAFAAYGLIPIGAFQSLSAEHDDQTRDLLILSNLSPGQIVRGKFFTFFMLALLLTVSLLPFFVLSALMRGVDLITISTDLAMTLLKSVGYTILAICLSSLSANRGLRVVLLIVMMIFILLSEQFIAVLTAFSPVGAGPQVVGVALITLVVGAFAYVIACGRFAHLEENRSTALRVLVVAVVFGLNLLFAAIPGIVAGSGSFAVTWPTGIDPQVYYCSLLCLSIAGLFFAAEPSTLGRRARAYVPKRALQRLVALPFLPGGGKAVVWYLSVAGAYVTLVAVVGLNSIPGMGWRHHILAGYVAIAATLGLALLPSALLQPLTRKAGGRVVLVVGTIVLLLISTTTVEMYREFAPLSPAVDVMRAASPFTLVLEIARHGLTGGRLGAALIIGVFVLISLLLNLRRIVREIRELSAAGRVRRELAQPTE